MENSFTPNLLEALGLTLFHSVWELTLIGLVLYLLLIGMNKSSAGKRYLISVGALALMALTPVVTFFLLYQPQVHGSATLTAIAWLAQASEPISPQIQSAEHLTFLENVLTQYRSVSSYVVAFWVLGAMILAFRLLGGYLYSRRLRKNGTTTVPQLLIDKLAELQRRMGILHPVKLLASTQVNVPVALGHIQPLILMPLSMLSGLTDTQIECILIHELAHIRRHDYLVNLFQRFVEIALFFHPAVWIVNQYIRDERENACDETVVAFTKNKLEYVNALLRIENLRANKPSLGIAATGGNLFARIKRIMEKQQPKPNYGHGALFLVLFAVAVALFLWNGVNESDDKPIDEKVALANVFVSDPGKDAVVLDQNGADQNFFVAQDSPVKKVTIITKEGEKIQGTLDEAGDIQNLTVNGEAVSGNDFDKYAAAVNRAMKGNVSVAVEDAGDGLSEEDQVKLETEMKKFGAEMEKLGQGFEGFGQGMDGLGTLMEGLGGLLEGALAGAMDGEISPEDEVKIEAWGEQFGADMEVWGEQFGRDMEKWGEGFERKMEAEGNWDEFEEKWENWGEEFGAKMENRAEKLEQLKEQGRDEEYKAEMKAMEKELTEGLGENLGEMLGELGERLGTQLGSIGTELGPKMDDAQREMEAAERKIEAAQRKLEAAQRKLDKAELKSDAASHHVQTVERVLRKELTRDRLINNGDDFDFRINQKNVWLNGKKLSKDHHKKYLEMLNEHTLVDLHQTGKFELEFED